MSFLYRSVSPQNSIQDPSRFLPAHWHPDLPYIRALAECLGFGSGTLARLHEKQGSMKAVWSASEHFLKSILSLTKLEVFLRRRDAGFSEDWLDLWRTQCEGTQATPLAFTDAAYPSLLKEISQFPLLLYVRGNPEVLKSDRNIAIVGTRRMSDYGRQVVRNVVSDLAIKKPCIVSGLAAGIDTEAHAGALVKGLPTIAVFGCGLDIIYPAKNKGLAEAIAANQGALLTECEFGEIPTKHSFPRRNRIVAGLCHATVVVEGDIKSGAMITARYALEEGRTVYAVPGRINDVNAQGPLKLIQQGAMPLLKAADLALDLGWHDVMTKPNTSSDQICGIEAMKCEESKTGVYTDINEDLSPATTKLVHSAGLSGRGTHGGEKIPTIIEGNSSAQQDENTLPDPACNAQESDALVLPSTLTQEERQVFSCLSEKPIAVEAVSLQLAWPVARVNECLSILELEGLANFWAGARVSRVVAT